MTLLLTPGMPVTFSKLERPQNSRISTRESYRSLGMVVNVKTTNASIMPVHAVAKPTRDANA